MNKHASIRLLCLSALLVPGLAGCTALAADLPAEPAARVEAIAGSDVKKVKLTQDAVTAAGVRTATVAGAAGGTLTVPYAAVIYYVDGTTWVYTVAAQREYVRVPITVARIAGEVATLAKGPTVGTPVVVQGGALLLGAELEIDGEQ